MQYLHIEIDVEAGFLNKLKPDLAASLPREIDAFKQELRMHNIPTIRVVTGGIKDFRAIPLLREDELLYQKEWDDIFRQEDFRDALKKERADADTLIITGVSTRLCISGSTKGALMEGYKCILPPDLFADIDEEKDKRLPPSWHQEKLEAHVYGELYDYLNQAKVARNLATYNAIWKLNNLAFVDSGSFIEILEQGKDPVFLKREISRIAEYKTDISIASNYRFQRQFGIALDSLSPVPSRSSTGRLRYVTTADFN